MRRTRLHGLRRRLSYANVMATLALFFALTGAATAGVKYLAATDPIPSTSDLGGSTYGNPMIAAGKVTAAKIADGAVASGKIADGAVTSAKLGTTARMWAVIQPSPDGSTVTVEQASKPGVTAQTDFDDGGIVVDFGADAPDLRSCALLVTPYAPVINERYSSSVSPDIFGIHTAEVYTTADEALFGGPNPYTPFAIAAFC